MTVECKNQNKGIPHRDNRLIDDCHFGKKKIDTACQGISDYKMIVDRITKIISKRKLVQ